MSNCVKLHVSIAGERGGRPYMEDEIGMHFEKLGDTSEDFAAFAVYDGHGGQFASVFARVSINPKQ